MAAQRALAGHDWPGGAAVRVRMGLHSGEPTRHEDGYIGMDVHRAARIAAAAHGGQVVMSDATRLLAATRLPAGVSVRDLGFHRLKDIGAPEHIFQLAGPGLRERFPPLKSLGAQTSLPVPADAADRAGRGPGALARRPRRAGGAAGDAHRPRRGGQDPAGPGGRRGAGRAPSRMACSSSPLAAVRDAEVMWKTLAGSLDVSAEGRTAERGDRLPGRPPGAAGAG